MEKYDNRVDEYIAKSGIFAQPILNHLRALVHQASPDIKETIKWSCPFFDLNGTVCQMAAFKEHIGFGFWKVKLLDDPYQILNQEEGTAGSIGRVTSLSELPDDDLLIYYIRQAIALNEKGVKPLPRVKTVTEKREVTTPDYFLQELDLNPSAKAHFEKFSPSQKKEYVIWLEEAKSESTRIKRLETAIEWISEGKIRLWKYKK